MPSRVRTDDLSRQSLRLRNAYRSVLFFEFEPGAVDCPVLQSRSLRKSDQRFLQLREVADGRRCPSSSCSFPLKVSSLGSPSLSMACHLFCYTRARQKHSNHASPSPSNSVAEALPSSSQIESFHPTVPFFTIKRPPPSPAHPQTSLRVRG